jgi:hypothetical protein
MNTSWAESMTREKLHWRARGDLHMLRVPEDHGYLVRGSEGETQRFICRCLHALKCLGPTFPAQPPPAKSIPENQGRGQGG